MSSKKTFYRLSRKKKEEYNEVLSENFFNSIIFSYL